MSKPKLCVCGCGASLEGMRETARYIDNSHARDHRRKLAKRPEGVPEMKWISGYWRRVPARRS